MEAAVANFEVYPR